MSEAVIVPPSKPIAEGASGVGSQRDRRWTDTFYDNHKHPTLFPNVRPFTGEREFRSGTSEPSESAGFITSDLSCGEFFCDNPNGRQREDERVASLATVWGAPWLPIAKYFRFNYRKKTIAFAYQRMIADETEGLNRYWQAAAKLAGENDVIDPDHPNKVPFRIRQLIGRPQDYTGKIRLAEAALSGDPWLLGFVKEPNEELAQILGIRIKYLARDETKRESVGHGDAEYVAVQSAPDKPSTTPEKVLSMTPEELQAIIAEGARAAVAAFQAEQKNKGQKKKGQAA